MNRMILQVPTSDPVGSSLDSRLRCQLTLFIRMPSVFALLNRDTTLENYPYRDPVENLIGPL